MQILSHLNYASLCIVSSVCKEFKILSEDETLWQEICKSIEYHEKEKPQSKTWKWLLQAKKVINKISNNTNFNSFREFLKMRKNEMDPVLSFTRVRLRKRIGIVAIGRMIDGMGMEPSFGQKDLTMRVTGKTIKGMALGLEFGM
jgi:hypothetical protein